MDTPRDPSPPTQTLPGGAAMPAGRGSLRRMGRYELVDELGRGGMGVVYRAWDPELGREVALKLLAAGPAVGAASRIRFLREARATARLKHPGIVRVYDLGEDDGNAWFTMQLIAGPTLSARLKAGPVETEQALRWVSAVARALQHAHEHNLIHRDVKPGNVLLEGGETPILADFGLVRHLDAEEAGLTHESQVLGTPAYMSPEQVLGGVGSVGPASDQYSLGVVLYELLAGVRPFTDTNPALLLRRILDEEAPPLPARVPRPLAAVVERAMQREASRRYPSCAAFAEDLDRVLRGEAVETVASSSTARLRQTFRRHQRPLGLVWRVGLAGAGLVGLLLLGLRLREDRQEEARAAAAATRGAALESRLRALFANGRAAEASEQLDAFAAFEGNQETPALASAWRTLGELRAGDGDTDGALDALANAWLLTGDRPGQMDVLSAMARVLHAHQQWAALGPVVDALRALDAPASADSRLWQRDLALVRGDAATAEALTEDPVDRAVLEGLTRGTPTAHKANAAAPIDLDHDGRDELVLLREFEAGMRVVDTTSPDLPFRGPGPGHRADERALLYPLRTDPGQRPLLVLSGDDTKIAAWDGSQWQPALYLPYGITGAESGDLDGDGATEHYLSYNVDVARIDVVGDALRVSSAAAEQRATNTAATGVLVTDLDADGTSELVVSTWTWAGYDLRLYQPQPGGPHLVTRRRIGAADTVRSLRLATGPALLAIRGADPRVVTNRQVFRPDEPEGEPMGMHVLVRGAQGLERRVVLPLPSPPPLPSSGQVVRTPEHLSTLLVGDLNGDGLDEIIYGYDGSWATVYVQHADGAFVALHLAGVFPLALAQLDGDPALEMVATRPADGFAVWSLGVGDQPIPAEALTVAEVRPRPSGLPADLAAAWDRAEALVAIGRTRPAAERLEVLAGMAQDEGVASAGRMRAGDLYASIGQHDAASRLYREAAHAPDRAREALASSMAAALADVDLSAALEAGKARSALGDAPDALRAEVEDLSRTLARPVHRFDFTRELDPVWRVETPVGITHHPGVGLEVLSAQRALLLSLPITWDGGPFRVELDLELTRMDWGGMLTLELSADPAGPRAALLRLATGGGAGVLEQSLRCIDGVRPFRVATRDATLTGRPLRLAAEVDTRRGRTRCNFEGLPSLDGHLVSQLSSRRLTPGRLWLQVYGNPGYDSQATAILHGLRLRGLDPVSEPSTREQEAWRLLALDRGAEAIEALRQADGARAGLGRAIAYDTLGRQDEARAALRAALAEDATLGGEIGRVFRGVLPAFEQDLRSFFGADYPLELWRYSAEIIEMHGAEAPAQELLTHSFAGIEDVDPRALADDPARLDLATILCRRAAAWRRAGRSGAALQDLGRAEQIATGVEARARDPEDLTNARRIRAGLARERSVLLLSRGEPDAAMDELLRGLAAAPAPTVFADLVFANPDFDPLRKLPGWAELATARSVWPAEPER